MVASTPLAPSFGIVSSAATVHDLFLKSGAEPSGIRTIPAWYTNFVRPRVRLGRIDVSNLAVNEESRG